MGKMPDAGKEAPTGLYERLEDPVIASQHSAEIEQLILTMGRSISKNTT